MTKFPFDRQTLKIHLEDGVNDMDSLPFVADIENSRASEEIILNDWELENFKFSEELHMYASGFGLCRNKCVYRLPFMSEVAKLRNNK